MPAVDNIFLVYKIEALSDFITMPAINFLISSEKSSNTAKGTSAAQTLKGMGRVANISLPQGW